MHRDRHHVALMFGVFALLMFAGVGCTSTRVIPLARYQVGGDAMVQPAPGSGFYKVQWAVERDGKYVSVDSTKRIVHGGAPLGFATTEDGQIIATAGPEEFPLKRIPPAAKFCTWSYTLKEETPLAKGVRRGLKATGETIVTAGAVVAIVALEAATDSLDDDDDGDDHHRRHHDRPAHHHHDKAQSNDEASDDRA